ncbi:ABC transporter permease [Clostridia bacterium]|nr:ABC transporter permease [Clostridia bacterium]
MRKHLRIMSIYFRMNLASALEYRASFITQAFGMALSNSAFIFFWWIAFSWLGGSIAGYTFEDVVFIWAISSSGFGLYEILFINVSRLTNLIVTGELDTFLLQPCNVLLNLACARTSLSAYGDVAYGIILIALVYGASGMAWLWFAIGVLVFGIIVTAIILTAHTLSFYWGDASLVGQMAAEFSVNFGIYPENIYGAPVRALMYSLIPIGIAVHVPLRMIHQFAPGIAAAALAGGAVYCALAVWWFYHGLKRYESGNAIVTRL